MNVQECVKLLFEGSVQTLYMSAISTIFAYCLGLPLGILINITGEKGLTPNSTTHVVLSYVVNIGRSIPFIILMLALLPLTRILVGTTIGPSAAVVPLVIAAAPFVARLVESSLEELDDKVIEAGKCMGATNAQIIFKIMLPESLPSLIRGISITAITIIGYSAMAGAVGGKGLGDIAIRYGYHRYEYGIMMATVLLLILIVQTTQFILQKIAIKIDKN